MERPKSITKRSKTFHLDPLDAVSGAVYLYVSTTIKMRNKIKWDNIKEQVLAGTCLDWQGEKTNKAVLEKLRSSFSRHDKFPLNQSHDMALKDVGYIENFSVVPDKNNDGEWCLVGDVYFHDVNLDEALTGFSYSVTEDLNGDLANKEIGMYLAHPYYNDEKLLDAIAGIEEGIVAGTT